MDAHAPTPAPNNDKGAGGRTSLVDLLEDLSNPNKARGSAGMLTRAIRAGYIDAFSIDYGALKAEAVKLSKSDKPRLSRAGQRLLMQMALHDLKLMEIADKSDRLDLGLATENLGGTVRCIKGVEEEAF